MKKFRCPLCGSLLSKNRYYEIIGVWEERQKLEKDLREQLQNLKREKQKLLREKKEFKEQLKEQMKKAVKEAFEKGRIKEKNRAERLSKMIQTKTQEIQNLNKKIKELQEQLKKGTTPQVEGLNLEEELAEELKKEFPEDKIEICGKNGDILHYVYFKNKNIGLILYECKKTAKFNSAFIDQTKKAMAIRKSNYGVLVTTSFKKNTYGFWVEKDILIVHPFGVIYLAHILRKNLIELYSLKISPKDMEKRSKELMEYIKSNDFKSAIEDSIYRTRKLYEMLLKERDSHIKIWKTRYEHYKTIYSSINRVEAVTSNILKGFSVKDSLKRVEIKQLPPA